MNNSLNLLTDKVCLITGASSGIGFAIARLFAINGAVVYVNSSKEDKVDWAVSVIREESKNERVFALSFDINDYEAVSDGIRKVYSLHKKIDVLVNNAGIAPSGLTGFTDPKVIEATFNTNVLSLINITQLAVKLMLRKGSGSIINLSSIMGINGASGMSSYSASKAAVIGFTKSLSKEVASKNIRVNAIAPGFIDTDMARGIDEKLYEERLSSIGMKRIGSPEDVANMALFLASEMSSYITGQVIGVDGGMVI